MAYRLHVIRLTSINSSCLLARDRSRRRTGSAMLLDKHRTHRQREKLAPRFLRAIAQSIVRSLVSLRRNEFGI